MAVTEAGKSTKPPSASHVQMTVDVLGKLELISEFVISCLLSWAGATIRMLHHIQKELEYKI